MLLLKKLTYKYICDKIKRLLHFLNSTSRESKNHHCYERHDVKTRLSRTKHSKQNVANAPC